MLFGLRTQVGPGNHILDGVQIPPMGSGNLRGEGRPIVKHRNSVVICAKTAKLMVIPFGLWARGEWAVS